MNRADLHVHSRFSDHPSEWFLQRIGTAESYTDPEYIYETAKKRGMTFVTITDHNSIKGALELRNRHPEDCFVSVESTVYFPEDGCKIHVLLFDITEEQFARIEEIRTDIYRFRDYLRDEDIAYSVAHATYSVNGAVGPKHLEKLILLFDVFETINGGRNRRNNDEWAGFLQNLTRADIEEMWKNHGIAPISSTPWIKGFTGGSDDHAGIFIAKTWTSSESESLHDFILLIKRRTTVSGGRHNDFHSMAFTIYKIAFDFIRSKKESNVPVPIAIILDSLFREQGMGLKKNHILKRFGKNNMKNSLQRIIADLVEEARGVNFHEMDARLDILYRKVALLTDQVVLGFIESAGSGIRKGHIDKLIRNFSSILPAVFLSIPIITTFNHMFNNRDLVVSLYCGLRKRLPERDKKILWFTDTITEMNGVAVTLRETAWIAHTMQKNIRIAAALDPDETVENLPPNILQIPVIKRIPLPYYEKLQLRIPSFLKALKLINDYDPDEIYISTPLSMGLLGLAASRLLKIPAVGIYHTDVTLQAKEIVNDITMTTSIEGFMKWFYSSCSRILVNTREYEVILGDRGYPREKIGLFRRGIDTDFFRPVENAKNSLQGIYGIPEGTYTLYAGRVSVDKNISLAVESFLDAAEGKQDHYLLIAGHGPAEQDLKESYAHIEKIRFLGRISHSTMPMIYSGSELLLFPSTTDTFGRVVAEAMSCGLPVLVSDTGGPKEILQDGLEEYIVSSRSPSAWMEKIKMIHHMIIEDPAAYRCLKESVRERIIEKYNLQEFINGLFGAETGTGKIKDFWTEPVQVPPDSQYVHPMP